MAGILCCMVLWQAGKTYSDSVDATGVSVSRARGVLDKVDLRRHVYTCIRVSDALLRVAARTKEDEGEWVLEMKAMTLLTARCVSA